MSSVVDFDALQQFMDVPEAARRLLSKPEKEIHFSLNIVSSTGALIEGDCYVVYHCSVRGPAKGGGAGLSSNRCAALGSTTSRCRARRSTNFRATTSSIVLEALFTVMSCSRLSSSVTSWLVVPSSSATV